MVTFTGEIVNWKLQFSCNASQCSAVQLVSTLGKKCQYSKFFWSTFSRIRTEYEDLWSKSPYSVRMWISPYSAQTGENADQKNFEYGQFLRSSIYMSGILVLGGLISFPDIFFSSKMISIGSNTFSCRYGISQKNVIKECQHKSISMKTFRTKTPLVWKYFLGEKSPYNYFFSNNVIGLLRNDCFK